MANTATVFGRGAFSAKPATPFEGWLYFATDHGILYRYSGSAWEAYSVPGIVFAFSTTTTDADPGAGTLRFNHATPASVTQIFVDDTPLNSGADLGTVFDNLTGARVLVQQADDPAKYLLGEVTADTDGTGYWKLTVTVDDSGTLIDDGALVSFVVLGGGGGSGAAALWWDSYKANIVSYTVFHDGDIAQGIGEIAQLLSGTIDGDGQTGAGGFTETAVACSCFNDTTPATSTVRGLNIFDQDIRVDTGHYFRASVRFPVKDDQNLYIGFFESSFHVDTGVLSSTECIGLMVRDGTDTNWQVVHNDGSTGQTIVDSGVAYNASNWLNVEIWVYDDGGTITGKVWINGTLVATTTTNMPLAATLTLRPFIASWFQSTGDTGSFDQVFFCNHMKWVAYDENTLETNGWATSLT